MMRDESLLSQRRAYLKVLSLDIHIEAFNFASGIPSNFWEVA